MKRAAFSLVELSIVLVILGLLVGGILAGQSLIRASELRSVGAEYDRYQTALHAFRDKYFAVPGDMANATSVWGAGTCPGDHTTPSSGLATCNGNGDGGISGSGNEMYRFWQHLANAGLIEGTYTGVPISAASLSMTPGVNVPAAKMSGSAWSMRQLGTQSGSSDTFDGVYNDTFQFGGSGIGVENASRNLLPQEAWNIDVKLDDSMPGLGKIKMRGGKSNSCVAGTDPVTTSYNLGRTDMKLCNLLFPRVI